MSPGGVRRERGPDDRIRVAFLTPSLHAGGAERQLLILAAALPRSRFDVRFILIWERGEWAPEAEAIGVPIDVLGLRPEDCRRPGLRCARATVMALSRYFRLVRDVDIVDAWLVPAFTLAGFAQPLARVPIVIGGRRSLLDLYRTRSWLRRAAAAWASRRMSAIVANSRQGALEAVSRERLDGRRVHVIPNAVIPVSVDRETRARLRAGWGFGPADVVVGCVANYKRSKGLESVVAAAGQLRATVPELRYVLVGEGPLRARLEDQIESLGLGSVVVLNGRADDARLLYPAFDVAVQASETEGLPNVVLEAASAGLPIVATAVGGTPEVLSDEESGILMPDATPERLAAALLRLARDPALRDRLGDAARARSMAFSAGRLAESTAALYERLIAERRRP